MALSPSLTPDEGLLGRLRSDHANALLMLSRLAGGKSAPHGADYYHSVVERSERALRQAGRPAFLFGSPGAQAPPAQGRVVDVPAHPLDHASRGIERQIAQRGGLQGPPDPQGTSLTTPRSSILNSPGVKTPAPAAKGRVVDVTPDPRLKAAQAMATDPIGFALRHGAGAKAAKPKVALSKRAQTPKYDISDVFRISALPSGPGVAPDQGPADRWRKDSTGALLRFASAGLSRLRTGETPGDRLHEWLGAAADTTGAVVAAPKAAIHQWSDTLSQHFGNGKPIDPSIYENDPASRISNKASDYAPYAIPGLNLALGASQIAHLTTSLASDPKGTIKSLGRSVNFLEPGILPEDRFFRTVNLATLVLGGLRAKGEFADAMAVKTLTRDFGMDASTARVAVRAGRQHMADMAGGVTSEQIALGGKPGAIKSRPAQFVSDLGRRARVSGSVQRQTTLKPGSVSDVVDATTAAKLGKDYSLPPVKAGLLVKGARAHLEAKGRGAALGGDDAIPSHYRADARDVAAGARGAGARAMQARSGTIGKAAVDAGGRPVSGGAMVRADGVSGPSGRFAAKAVADPSFQEEHTHGVVTPASAQRLARLEPGLGGAPITFTADRTRHGIRHHGREGIDPAPLRAGDYDRVGDLVNDPNARVTRAPKSDRRANTILTFEDYDAKGSKIFANYEVKPTENGPKLELLSPGMEGGTRYQTPQPSERRLWPGKKASAAPRTDEIASDVPYRISPSWPDDEADPVVVAKRRFDKSGVSQRKQADMHVRSTNRLLGSHSNEETGWALNVNRKSLKGATFNGPTAEAIDEIPEIMRKAVRIESFDPKPSDPNSPRLHLFATPLTVEGRPYVVRFVVSDSKLAGYKLVHEVLAMDVQGVGGPSLAPHGAVRQGPRAHNTSLRDFLQNYRFSDESPVVPHSPIRHG